jgi:hypothetical protein
MVLCIIIALLAVWTAGPGDIVGFFMLLIPTWLVLVVVAVRVAPFLLPPTLVEREQSHITTPGPETAEKAALRRELMGQNRDE